MHRSWILVAAAMLLSVSGCRLHGGPGSTWAYVGTGTFVGSVAGGGSQAVPSQVEIYDCLRHAGDPLVATVQIGSSCRLSGSWPWESWVPDDGPKWHQGRLIVTPDQVCTLKLNQGDAVLRVTNGVVNITDGRFIEIALGGHVVGGQVPAGPATFNFTAPPQGIVHTFACPDAGGGTTTRRSNG